MIFKVGDKYRINDTAIKYVEILEIDDSSGILINLKLQVTPVNNLNNILFKLWKTYLPTGKCAEINQTNWNIIEELEKEYSSTLHQCQYVNVAFSENPKDAKWVCKICDKEKAVIEETSEEEMRRFAASNFFSMP